MMIIFLLIYLYIVSTVFWIHALVTSESYYYFIRTRPIKDYYDKYNPLYKLIIKIAYMLIATVTTLLSPIIWMTLIITALLKLYPDWLVKLKSKYKKITRKWEW